jgi:uncharacterized Zn-finger protein
MYKCNVCGQGFSRKDNLARHANVKHTKDEISCDICDKKFLRKDKYKQHVKVHAVSSSPSTSQATNGDVKESLVISISSHEKKPHEPLQITLISDTGKRAVTAVMSEVAEATMTSEQDPLTRQTVTLAR